MAPKRGHRPTAPAEHANHGAMFPQPPDSAGSAEQQVGFERGGIANEVGWPRVAVVRDKPEMIAGRRVDC